MSVRTKILAPGLLPMIALAVAIAAVAGADSRGPVRLPQQGQLRHDAAAVVKLVAVRVLGKDGRPVTGLQREDFTLFEDGQRKPITEFEVHALTEAGMTVTPGPAAGNAAAAQRGGAVTRKIFFFLDQQASDQAGKVKAKTAALRFLDTQVRPGDQVAVIGFYAMSGFYIREYLTTDMARIRRAINKPSEAPPRGGDVVVAADDAMDAGAMSEGANVWVAGGESRGLSGGSEEASDASPAGGMGAVFVPGTAAFQRADFLPRMLDLVEVFKTIPGTKSLVLFTARDLGSEAEHLGKLLGATGTSVFAVNTQDWKASPMGGAKVHFIWWNHSLKDLSAASGGKYFADINDPSGIASDVQDLTGHYYILGYYVREAWEGSYHKIRVEVARPETRVLVQDGYFDPKPFAKMSDFEKDIQLLDLTWSEEPGGNPLPLPVEPLVVEVGKIAQACLLSAWDVGGKTAVPASRVEIFALLRGEAGVPLVSRKWDADLASHKGKVLFPYLSTAVPRGACELRLVVRDRATGEAWIGRVRFDVGAAKEEGIVLASPLVFEPGAEAAYMRLPMKQDRAAKGKRGAEGLSLMDLYGLVPKNARPVVGEVAAGTRRLIAVLPYEIRPRRPGDEPILAVEVKLIAALDGGETPLQVKVDDWREPAAEGRPDVLLAEITIPEMPAGSYVLEISLEDVGTERRASVRKPLVLR